ncbi:MAG TPA: hypothetical protein PLO61_03810 [Fimbriimonadaceae bacterium]|nr:hypothetical protein [Fimbriimonadaceae bacterium]HRJ32757.1 hypothetical protein [Fimbriimonadaceae bacterium]
MVCVPVPSGIARGVALAGVLLSFASSAWADRIAFLPSARKISMTEARAEWLFSSGNKGTGRGSFGIGLGPSFEVEIEAQRPTGQGWLGSLSFSYNYLEPLKDMIPGLAAGFRDVLNRTPEGRVFFACVTYASSTDNLFGSITPVDLTLGVQTGRASGAYVGVSLPFSDAFQVVAEADRRQITGGLRIQPLRGFRAQVLIRRTETYWGLSYSIRF